MLRKLSYNLQVHETSVAPHFTICTVRRSLYIRPAVDMVIRPKRLSLGPKYLRCALLFFPWFPCVGVRLVYWSLRITATFVICFHWSLLLAFSLHFSSSSAFLGSLFTQSSHLSCGLHRFLKPSLCNKYKRCVFYCANAAIFLLVTLAVTFLLIIL